jgi:hypothetical protein
MKRVTLFVVFACAAGFAQSPSANTFDPQNLLMGGIGDKSLPLSNFSGFNLNLPVDRGVCAVPLLGAPLKPTEKMPVFKPSMQSFTHELEVKPPAPACDEKLFQNK